MALLLPYASQHAAAPGALQPVASHRLTHSGLGVETWLFWLSHTPA
jgi:hypothetical protein